MPKPSSSSTNFFGNLWTLARVQNKYEPRIDKTNKMSVCPAKTHISLGIRPVWSECSLCAKWIAKDPSFLHADSEDWSDWADAQADLSVRWAHSHFVGFVMSRFICLLVCLFLQHLQQYKIPPEMTVMMPKPSNSSTNSLALQQTNNYNVISLVNDQITLL